MDTRIHLDRLKKDILDLSQIGRTEGSGISRPSFSKSDFEAREWLKERFRSAGLNVRQDGAGNIFGRIKGEGKTVMAGSHIDSVINGGMFDGPAGVLSALECLRRIQEDNIPVVKPLEVVSFTDEEGNLVGDFLGSRAFIGSLDRKNLEEGVTQFGLPFSEILKGTEFTVDSIMNAHLDRPEIEAFLEIHLEQGPVLEAEDISIGIVDRIAGKNHWLCSFLGKASHAGTTPFELRHDAFIGLSNFALKATQHVATHHYGSLVTIGKVFVFPGAFSIVPGRADFSLDFRSTSKDTLEAMVKALLEMAEEEAATRGLEFSYKIIDTTEPTPVTDRITNLLSEECGKLDYSQMTLPSGAGHDAQILAEITDSGLIFIPCEDGISHSPEENIKWEDLEKATNLLLHALVSLAT
ncbi:MAG: Zn-dependent hydrolase [Candidatus Aminicenantes bacterium]|nr:Zn-dependent hydrolase [Candidatus Aminicenantes bacterium]